MDAKYKRGLMFSLVLVSMIALFDIWSMSSGIFGTPTQYTTGEFTVGGSGGWWPLFFKFNLAIIIVFALGYYVFYKEDISETLGIMVAPFVLWFFGLADLLFFAFQGLWPPATLPWLNNSIIISSISKFMGYKTVTSTSLLISIVLGFILAFYATKYLEKIN